MLRTIPPVPWAMNCLAANWVPKNALEIDVHDPLILVFGRVQDRGAGLDTGVVHQHVQLAEAVDRGLDHLVQVGGLADVGQHADRAAAGLLDAVDEVGRLVGVHDVVDDQLGAFGGGGGEHDRFSDAAVASGHDHGLAVEKHVVLLPSGVVVAGWPVVVSVWRPGRVCQVVHRAAGDPLDSFTSRVASRQVTSRRCSSRRRARRRRRRPASAAADPGWPRWRRRDHPTRAL